MPESDPLEVRDRVLARLYQCLNPLKGGGLDGKGWPFGRSLYASDVYQFLHGIPGVQFLERIEMYAAQASGEPRGGAIERLEVLPHGVVASGLHSVEVIKGSSGS